MADPRVRQAARAPRRPSRDRRAAPERRQYRRRAPRPRAGFERRLDARRGSSAGRAGRLGRQHQAEAGAPAGESGSRASLSRSDISASCAMGCCTRWTGTRRLYNWPPMRTARFCTLARRSLAAVVLLAYARRRARAASLAAHGRHRGHMDATGRVIPTAPSRSNGTTIVAVGHRGQIAARYARRGRLTPAAR